MDCLAWSRWGPSKSESISILWNIILLGMVVQRHTDLQELKASLVYIDTYLKIQGWGCGYLVRCLPSHTKLWL